MKRIDIPRPRRPRSFSEKFGREAAFFGSRAGKEAPRWGHIPLVMMCLLGATVLTVAILLLGRLWKVRAVSATDGQLYTAVALTECADVEAGDEMLGFDCAAVAKRLRERLPLLDDVKVRRHLNGTVSIHVTEQTSLYYTRHNMNYYILSADTREVLCVSATPDEARRVGAIYVGVPESARVRVGETLTFVNLPYASEDDTVAEYTTYEAETDEPEQEYAYVLECLEAIMDTPLAARVTGMELGDRYELYFVLDGHIKVRIGSMDELDRKLMLAERSLADKQAAGGMTDTMPTLVDVSDPARIIHRSSPDIVLPDWAGR